MTHKDHVLVLFGACQAHYRLHPDDSRGGLKLIKGSLEKAVSSCSPDDADVDDAFDYQTFVSDLLGFIAFCEKQGNEEPFSLPSYIASNLLHDLGGVVRKESCFLPRVTGYKKHL